MKRVIVVGGGIFGTMHALLAAEKGFAVTHLEENLSPQLASVRNFGLIWVSGRVSGPELNLAIRSRALWESIGAKTQIGFRANGSLTVAQNAEEFALVEEAASLPDAGLRGFRALNRNETENVEPGLNGKLFGSLQCTLDAVVEPPLLLGGLRKYLNTLQNYNWVPGAEVINFYHNENGNHVVTNSGAQYSAEYISICPGAIYNGFLTEHLVQAPLRKVRLQMAATSPLDRKVKHSIADADSMRYYPAFKDLQLHLLQPQSEVAAKFKMQLLLVQRIDGTLTIGDTHEYQEPFTHELAEAPYDHLLSVIQNIFGGNLPRIERRWDGIYSQTTGTELYYRKEIAPGACVVTGGGGRGNTLAPAIAEETLTEWAL